MNRPLYGDENVRAHDTTVTLSLLRKKLAEVMGVTLMGNRLTMRLADGREVYAVILEVNDGIPCSYCQQNHDADFCPKEYADEEANSK